jgi:transcription elongation factor GreA
MIDRDKPCYLTPGGKQKLEQELEELRTVRRPALAATIRESNGFGGFNETELDDLMNEQTQLDAHIKDLEFMLRHAILVEDGGAHSGTVTIGARVTVRDGSGEEILWTIVGSAEADMRRGKISNESLVGAALLGHRTGEVVQVQAPAGLQEYTILKVE